MPAVLPSTSLLTSRFSQSSRFSYSSVPPRLSAWLTISISIDFGMIAAMSPAMLLTARHSTRLSVSDASVP